MKCEHCGIRPAMRMYIICRHCLNTIFDDCLKRLGVTGDTK